LIPSDAEFYGRWKGWLKISPNLNLSNLWSDIAPEDWKDVEAVPPPENCTWND
jgi:hypothetical protein